MSLNFDVSKIKDHEKVTTNPFDSNRWHPVTEALISCAMICGFSSITEKNVETVKDRIAQYQTAVGPLLAVQVGQMWITDADVEAHIGLSTNADSKTDKQWLEKLAKELLYEARWKSRSAQVIPARDLFEYMNIGREPATAER
jgi:hypothetical protein